MKKITQLLSVFLSVVMLSQFTVLPGYAEGSTNDNESQVYGVYNGVTVGVITDANGGLNTTIGTIFPDSLQRSIGDF